MRLRGRTYIAVQWAGVLCLGALAVLSSRAADYRPPELFALLLVLVLVGDRLKVQVYNQHLSAAFVAMVLAMTLLGPAPAALIGAVMAIVDAIIRRLDHARWLNNLLSYLAMMLAGAFLTRLAVGPVHPDANVRGAVFVVVVFGVFFASNLVNFSVIALNKKITEGRSLQDQVVRLLAPMLPGQFAAAMLTAFLAIGYTNLGFAALPPAFGVIFVFQYLAIALMKSERRAEALEDRTRRMATLQLGVIVTLVETLQLRDPMTARHAATVARYSRLVAHQMGLSPREQEYAHAAGLLHDIGKFAFPDRILHAAGAMSAADRAIVERHPEQGARLVGRLDGYGPVADAILHHHERIDGLGYPAQLIGPEIPVMARIVAACETLDVLTAPGSYRGAVLPMVEAVRELEAHAGRQFDREVVTAIDALVRDGAIEAPSGSDSDAFERELDFERRVWALSAVTPQAA